MEPKKTFLLWLFPMIGAAIATSVVERSDILSEDFPITREQALLILKYAPELPVRWNGTVKNRARWMQDLPLNVS